MATGVLRPVLLRLHPRDHELLDQVAEDLGSARSGTVAIAIRHLAATLQAGNPVHMTFRSNAPS